MTFGHRWSNFDLNKFTSQVILAVSCNGFGGEVLTKCTNLLSFDGSQRES